MVADEPALRQSIETAARLAASNARLRAGLRSEADELRASQLRLLSAADDQRIALAQQLGRGAGASLMEIAPLLDAVPADATPRSEPLSNEAVRGPMASWRRPAIVVGRPRAADLRITGPRTRCPSSVLGSEAGSIST